MCGLVGILDTRHQKSHEQLCAAIRPMAAAIHHRGPDDAGQWIDEVHGIGLGFQRLAILDLSKAGHQPMVSPDGERVLIFNGEIYNHLDLRAEVEKTGLRVAWRGHSDTETLLICFAAWGIRRTLEHAVGMFALALWDRGERRLYLARDRFGEKPLYYGWTDSGTFIFGSELKALRSFPGFDNEIDRDALALYAEYSCVPAPYSIFRNVFKLEPGCLLTLPTNEPTGPPAAALLAPAQHRNLTVERYWSLMDTAHRGLSMPLCDEAEALARLERVLMDAVRIQSIADVPLGAFLSGGIDSSTIVALMQAQSMRPVKTFTIGFEELAFNEAVHAKAVAHHLGTEHQELYVTAEEARDVIPRLPDIYSEPFADVSQIPTHLVCAMARRHVTVALSGDGGDEMFGGYTRHFWVPRVWNRMRMVPPPLRRVLGDLMQRIPATAWDLLGASLPRRRRVRRLGDKAYKLGHRLKNVAAEADLYRMLLATWPNGGRSVAGAARSVTPLAKALSHHEIADSEHRMMFWDALAYLPDDILHKVDRASMAVSLETRAPFLDHRVAEVAWRIPVEMKIRNGSGKWILRRLLYRYVPPALIDRPKMGFGVPIDAWLRGPLRGWAEELLDESKLRAQGYWDPAAVRRKWIDHVSGRRSWPNELWCVLMFQAWQESASR